MAVALVVGAAVLLRIRADRSSAVAVLGLWVLLGAARHHVVWSVRADNDVSLYAADEARPVRLTAVIASQPAIRLKSEGATQSAWPQLDSSVCVLDCRTIRSGTDDVRVAGRAQLRVSGHLLHVAVGDVVEVRGWMSRPPAPANPGEFDYRVYLRRGTIGCAVSTQDPDAVSRLGRDRGWDFRRVVAWLRGRCAAALAERLTPENAPVAAAMLFGDRSGLTDLVETDFAQSGTMHILAISGFNVGVLAGFCWLFCRLLNLSSGATCVVVLAAIAGLTLLSDGSPSVVRAAVLAALLLLGRHWFRRVGSVNSLAAAALAVLVWNPTDLFDIGAQLSFLAVLGILWSQRQWAGRVAAEEPRPLPESGLVRKLCQSGARWLAVYVWTVLGITIWTAPLIAWAFHLVSPIGLPINLVAAPVAAVALCLGYVFLPAAALFPALAGGLAPIFDAALWLFRSLVHWGGSFRPGYLYVPGPALWWLSAYYGVLIAGALVPQLRLPARREWQVLLAWTATGLVVGLIPARPPGLRCTFLAVGHGGGILVEFPNGRTLLYDAGSINDADHAQRVIRNALWARGHSRIDALVISHADLDHMNAAPGLLRAVPVGEVLIARAFLDFRQPAVVAVCDAASAEGVPIRIVRRGDRIAADDSAAVEILHPDLDERHPLDNANSVVLDVAYAGRRILLTGDLEQEGLRRLLAQAPRAADVLLAPHHGSAKPNAPPLARWANPRYVVASASKERILPHLWRTYGAGGLVWSTGESGAVTFTITPGGDLAARRQRE